MVDDAIVVIENVQRHIAMEHSDPHEATSRAMGEVTSAVIATSLVLIAVFVPVSFFPGTTGILYRQFSLTIAFSIAISAFNALTLSPALSAMFLRGEEERPHQLDFLHIRPVSRAFAAFIHGADAAITWLASTYAKSIHVALRLRYLLLLVFFAGLGATVWMYQHVPTGFIPQEDQGYVDGDRAGAAGIFADLHHGAGRARGAHHLDRIPILAEPSPSSASALPAAPPTRA